MGNCNGVFSACVGEDNTAIKKIDKDNLKRALQANVDLSSANLDGSNQQFGGQHGFEIGYEHSNHDKNE